MTETLSLTHYTPAFFLPYTCTIGVYLLSKREKKKTIWDFPSSNNMNGKKIGAIANIAIRHKILANIAPCKRICQYNKI